MLFYSKTSNLFPVSGYWPSTIKGKIQKTFTRNKQLLDLYLNCKLPDFIVNSSVIEFFLSFEISKYLFLDANVSRWWQPFMNNWAKLRSFFHSRMMSESWSRKVIWVSLSDITDKKKSLRNNSKMALFDVHVLKSFLLSCSMTNIWYPKYKKHTLKKDYSKRGNKAAKTQVGKNIRKRKLY